MNTRRVSCKHWKVFVCQQQQSSHISTDASSQSPEAFVWHSCVYSHSNICLNMTSFTILKVYTNVYDVQDRLRLLSWPLLLLLVRAPEWQSTPSLHRTVCIDKIRFFFCIFQGLLSEVINWNERFWKYLHQFRWTKAGINKPDPQTKHN